MCNFQPLEVVDRGSETQLQVVDNLNEFTPQDKGRYPVIPKPLCVENLLRDAKSCFDVSQMVKGLSLTLRHSQYEFVDSHGGNVGQSK